MFQTGLSISQKNRKYATNMTIKILYTLAPEQETKTLLISLGLRLQRKNANMNKIAPSPHAREDT